MTIKTTWMSAVVGLALACAATRVLAQAGEPPPLVKAEPSRVEQAKDEAAKVASSPLKDANIVRTKIPPILQQAAQGPYALPAPLTCKSLGDAIAALDEVLEADLDAAETPGASRFDISPGAMAESFVHGLTPMRSWLRKLSGAEKADAQVQHAIFAGSVRRAYLKGVGLQRGCPVPAAPRGVAAPPLPSPEAAPAAVKPPAKSRKARR
jgi:hypothetical protein